MESVITSTDHEDDRAGTSCVASAAEPTPSNVEYNQRGNSNHNTHEFPTHRFFKRNQHEPVFPLRRKEMAKYEYLIC